jgi:outer membrane protein OmpA-like peptidoglycan-associated protein
MRVPAPELAPTFASSHVSRKCTACGEEKKEEKLQEKETEMARAAAAEAPAIVHEVLRSPGEPLDESSRTHFEPVFGYDFSRVRVHTDTAAVKSARDVGARAYTVGQNIVFGAGQFTPGSQDGQRLLVHELAHVVQQRNGAVAIQRSPDRPWLDRRWIRDANAARYRGQLIAGRIRQHGLLSKDARTRIINELAYFEGAARDVYIAEIRPALEKVGALDVLATSTEPVAPPKPTLFPLDEDPYLCGGQKCPSEEDLGIAEPPKAQWTDYCYLPKGTMEWKFGLPEKVEHVTSKRRMQIKFTPMPSYRGKMVTFLQTFSEQGGSSSSPRVDIGTSGQQDFEPFYGVKIERAKWITEDVPAPPPGNKTQPSSAGDPAAYMYDEPYYFPPPHGRVFESAAVVPETGETLAVLKWGVGEVPADAKSPVCSETPSAAHGRAVELWYTPKMTATGGGYENYDAILDGFDPDYATLSPDQIDQLASLVEKVKAVQSSTSKFQVVVAGFGDKADQDPVASSQRRADEAANFLVRLGVSKDRIVIWGMGASWARFELSSKEAQAGRNRRVQIRLFKYS